MHWNNLDDFLSMGGYGFYVWSSFLVTFALIFIEVILLKRADSDSRRRLKRMQQWETE